MDGHHVDARIRGCTHDPAAQCEVQRQHEQERDLPRGRVPATTPAVNKAAVSSIPKNTGSCHVRRRRTNIAGRAVSSVQYCHASPAARTTMVTSGETAQAVRRRPGTRAASVRTKAPVSRAKAALSDNRRLI
jgi:hypothetical protein